MKCPVYEMSYLKMFSVKCPNTIKNDYILNRLQNSRLVFFNLLINIFTERSKFNPLGQKLYNGINSIQKFQSQFSR